MIASDGPAAIEQVARERHPVRPGGVRRRERLRPRPQNDRMLAEPLDRAPQDLPQAGRPPRSLGNYDNGVNVIGHNNKRIQMKNPAASSGVSKPQHPKTEESF